MSDCQLWYDFDFSSAAGMYSQLGGTLAGFAFVAITLMLNRQHRREALGVKDPIEELVQDRRCVAALGCSFLGLIATTTLYATASGEQTCALIMGRGASEEVLAGVAFAFSLYTLLFAAVQLVSAAALGTHLRFIVAVITPPIVVAFIMATLGDLALSLASPPANVTPGQPIDPVWTPQGLQLWERSQSLAPWLTAGVLVVAAVVWAAGIRVRRSSGQPTRVVSVSLTLLPYVSLGLVLFAVWRSLELSDLDPGDRISPGEAWWLVGISIAIVLAQSVSLSLERGEEYVELPGAS